MRGEKYDNFSINVTRTDKKYEEKWEDEYGEENRC